MKRLQSNPDSRLADGDIIALDDSKIEHPFGKKIPFLCWLFDSSEKRHVWCMNLVSTLAVLKMAWNIPCCGVFGSKSIRKMINERKLILPSKCFLRYAK
ncbi:MAG: hypothetical protein ACOX3R_16325 [Desulfitobacteriia bacterium]